MHTATAALARIARADSATWGQALEASARAAAVLLVAAYAAGLVLGAWVHRLSGALGAIAGRPHRPAAPQRPAEAPAARRAHRTAPIAARPAPAATERHQAARAALDGLTVPQLRQLARQAGHRALARSGRRVDLLQALAA
jgi:hypothetical protein